MPAVGRSTDTFLHNSTGEKRGSQPLGEVFVMPILLRKTLENLTKFDNIM
jgi:hypothetical protein